jgi:glycosyltransferase involved in cell wall biosynthesis
MNKIKDKLPDISIVTCSYQQAKFLDATMRSVLDQRYVELEYIVIDGGSTDGSLEIIQRHADHLAYWISEPDDGQTAALIKGFKHSTAEIQGWLCSDDLLLPGALKTVSLFFDSNPDIDAVYGDSLWIDSDGHYLRPKKEIDFNRFTFLFDHNYISQPSMFWRKRLYDKVNGLDASFNLAMDADLWERFSRHTKIAHIPQYLSCMRYYPEQKTRALRPKGIIEDRKIRQRSGVALSKLHPILAPIAKLQRVFMKMLAGGYYAKPSAKQLASLKHYFIHGETS